MIHLVSVDLMANSWIEPKNPHKKVGVQDYLLCNILDILGPTVAVHRAGFV